MNMKRYFVETREDVGRYPQRSIRGLRNGFTLIEAVMSMLVVGIMMVAAMNTIGASRMTQSRVAERAVGPMLAEDLMSEILSQGYKEPDETTVFGRESSESGGNRSDWDDVDDYDGWSKSPPQNKDGTVIPDLDGWKRSVTVQWVKSDSLTEVGVNTGIKRIDVTVTHKDRVVSELSMVRTEAWPGDGQVSLSVLLVVINAASPTGQELHRKGLMESWGYSVELITAADNQSAFDAAAGRNHVAYIPEDVSSDDVNTKLKRATIGIVIEERLLMDDFGISPGASAFTNTSISITDNSHYITQDFSKGDLAILTSPSKLCVTSGSLGGGVSTLATPTFGSDTTLAVLEVGGALYSGGKAASRRVKLPWGDGNFDGQLLNSDGETIMKRSIEWAANWEQQ
jgi:prepilin-type N-terminal cleavage/methylation domain-containing protein